MAEASRRGRFDNKRKIGYCTFVLVGASPVRLIRKEHKPKSRHNKNTLSRGCF